MTSSHLAPSVLLSVAIGSILGAGARAVVTEPWDFTLWAESLAIVLLTIVGASGMGWWTGYVERRAQSGRNVPLWLNKGLGMGFIGSFTTLSALLNCYFAATVIFADAASRVEPWVAVIIAGVIGLGAVAATAALGTFCAVMGLRAGRRGAGSEDQKESTP